MKALLEVGVSFGVGNRMYRTYLPFHLDVKVPKPWFGENLKYVAVLNTLADLTNRRYLKNRNDERTELTEDDFHAWRLVPVTDYEDIIEIMRKEFNL